MAFDNMTGRQLDWVGPATPTWQVYDGQVAVTAGGAGTLDLSTCGSQPWALVVRKGF